MIKVLTDQSASDREPAIILKESNPHSKPPLSPNMKGNVIRWQLGKAAGGAQKKIKEENVGKEKGGGGP